MNTPPKLTPELFQGTLPAIPAHVPADRVFDFDFLSPIVDDPIAFWEDLDKRNVPEIFFTPHNGGHWLMRRLEDVEAVMRDAERFTNFPTGLPVEPGRPAVIPLEIDPPFHQKYRQVLAPLFTPVAVKARESRIREVAIDLIQRVQNKGECDFVRDIAAKFPPALFLEFMGMPVERLSEFLEWEEDFLRGEPDTRKVATQKIAAYLNEFLTQHKRTPEDTVTWAMLSARDENGEPWSHDELMSASFMLFTAGLDTVTNTMGFIWRYLANNPDARRYIITNLDDRLKMACIFDELMRTNTVPTDTRRVRADFVYKGLLLKQGDVVVLPLPIANRDPVLVDNPDQVDLTRDINRHIAFGTGPHRCLGSLLAKAEIEICLQEWLTRIPDFSIAPNAKINCWVKVIAGMESLPLVWDVKH